MSNAPTSSPEAPDAPAVPKLSDMNLSIGQPVQLVLHGAKEYKHYSRLVGFVEPEYVLLRVPTERGWAVELRNGQAAQVRMFSGLSIYEFSTYILQFQLHPRYLMLLEYPQTIHEQRLREHERVRCQWPVKVSQGSQVHTNGFELQDLSGGGAALVGPQPLGDVGQTLVVEIAFHLQATDSHEQLRLAATVQTLEVQRASDGTPTAYKYGIRFEKVDARILLFVNELQKRASGRTAP